ncbi:MAG: hypothetical protein A3I77_04990 [Gammaproteobacteria bacterium RIFCSPLOWO2_02_FULL_42_14]|nr:MAG: hypothetical protein A3B71_06290 [Gammaproteobacteria bacterium RIFCSPHIGHO2_02_FULL_42_43]OGT28679.1 MAG: hypothetical protein A2624_00980 [Gammaproteobacteria bacterium RIFCSPHIGHO2_01_FULL_42_8]OGT51590.1 MAG: hypothetical protein A3E54_06055 [Gammaproteobacteria bacterium RIFCSPHIGHO2_12_FULL_41_25]OGT62289.1 MAG: hypothetical protein A3I77_04990 [Gammaproteobacteria bacterium RIFCSPLOWO2_02_FULL_42_14]OGT85963.1 MAG: hypothetical protein A3G86_04680 [Gammaproteobacteria bacterium R
MQSYKHHFLVSMPQMRGEFFSRAVVYIYEHSQTGGAIGFTINKPLSATLGNVLEHLKIAGTDKKIAEVPVFSGGPVGPDQGFVLHDRMSMPNAPGDQEITIGTSRDILKEIGEGRGPDHFLVLLGYSGWGAGQLEMEIGRNDWLVLPFQKAIVFDIPIAERWVAAARIIGIDFNQLSSQTGHA